MTFSIVARDPETEAIGIAVQSKFVSVGSVVPFASADAGAIATQSFANVAYGPDGLDLLREGYSAEDVIDELERVFKLYDVTLLSRAEPEETTRLFGETATAVAATLEELGLYDNDRTAEFDGSTAEFDDVDRDALEAFRGLNNFENHDLDVLEDAIARGWDAAEGTGDARLVDAIWHGLQRLDRE